MTRPLAHNNCVGTHESNCYLDPLDSAYDRPVCGVITVFDAGFLKRGLPVVSASAPDEIATLKGKIEGLTKGLSQAKEQPEA